MKISQGFKPDAKAPAWVVLGGIFAYGAMIAVASMLVLQWMR